MSELFDRVVNNLISRKERIESGQINCIPFGLPRFEKDFPGVEQKTYYQITASTKVGKTQITDFLFMYQTLMYAYRHKEQVRIKVFYFSLEMSKEQKYQQMLCHILFRMSKGKIRIDPKDLRSTKADKPLPQQILEILGTDEYQDFFEFFEKNVVFIDQIRNPFGIYNFVRDYASTHGTQHKKRVDFTDNNTGEVKKHEIDDYYEPDDPDEYVMVIVDHMALLTPEKGMTTRDAMIELSAKYFIKMRNKFKYIPVAVIQQAAMQESNENKKLNKLRPTLDGFGDAKVISRDGDLILGLFAPYRHEIPEYMGYNITHWKDNIRFLEIIAGREGGGGTLCPLFFDGGVNYFFELPLPTDTVELSKAEVLVDRVKNNKVFMKACRHKK